ncbi:protein FAM78B isoform X1 [Heliangelus exortis]|uniref:protein FAM78B isoform X1 n=1 Tax=Heliangelus exortis TaxID=472823 RepID=UPI003A8D0CBF
METGRLFAAPPGGAEVRPLPPGAGTQGTAPPARCTAAGEGHKCHGGGAFAPPVRAPVRGRRCAAAAAVGRGKRRGAGLPPTRPRGSAAAGEGGSVAMGCLQSVACKARVRREQIVVSDVSATIEPAATAIEESSPVVLRYRTPYFRASARVLMPPIARRHTWVVGWIQACNHMEFYNTYSDLGVSSWELPDLREGRVKAISDSDGVSYPWYGNTTETVTLVGPTNKISRFSVSMNDNFYPSVTWAVPVSNSNVPLLTRIKRDQSFTTWLVAMNTTTKEKIILQTIKWRMRVDIEVDPMQLLGQRARLVGRTQQEQPRILSRMEPIPPNALVKPNANDAQVLMWRPKRGQPIVVIPPK